MPKGLSTDDVICMVKQAICDHKPLSLVRALDGEAMVLSDDIDVSHRAWMGHVGSVPEHGWEEDVRCVLRLAIRRSTIVGIPHGKHKFAEMCAPMLATVSDHQFVCSPDIHSNMLTRHAYDSFIEAAVMTDRRIVLITGHGVVADRWRSIHPTGNVEWWPVPLQHRFFGGNGNRFTRESWDEMRNRVTLKTSMNDLVLVGCGFLGKGFVANAGINGAVALDIGHVFDAWAGFKTRGAGRAPGATDNRWRL